MTNAKLAISIACIVVPLPSWFLLGAHVTFFVDLGLIALFAAIFADALTPLGLLNFLVLQWFGVRVCKRTKSIRTGAFSECDIGVRIGWVTTAGVRERWHVVAATPEEVRLGRLGLLRWIWPLTGWWTDFRYIGRRS